MESINPPSVRRVVIEMRGASCVAICQLVQLVIQQTERTADTLISKWQDLRLQRLRPSMSPNRILIHAQSRIPHPHQLLLNLSPPLHPSMQHYYPRKRFPNGSTRSTHGSDDHTSKGDVCLNPRVVEDSKAADANANTVERIAVYMV